MNKAIFLDRDGTIIEEVDFCRSPDQVKLIPGAAAAIKKLKDAGFLLILCTNQSGIARGLLTVDDYESVHSELERKLQAEGVTLDAAYYCPHLPDAKVAQFAKVCNCRKPATGMFQQAAGDFDIDITPSWAVGDSLRDLAPARRIGASTILLRCGKPLPEDPLADPAVDFVADSLADACPIIFGNPPT